MDALQLIFGLIIIVVTFVQRSQGHGYMIEPAGRSSMWRKGFKTPINYDDNGVRCAMTDTRCGVCGNQDNEAGGKYATGTISRTYKTGQWIQINVVLTVNHMGYFQFSLCPTNPASESCFQRHILDLGNGQTKYEIKPGVTGSISLRAKLPDGLTCSQCTLRWYYKTGNSWGTDPRTGKGCLGCGTQERFFSCSDVRINN